MFTKAAVPNRVESEQDQIVVSDVSRSFRTGRNASVTALSHVDLRIRQGSFVTLFGPSGCGKSTLLRILAGLDTTFDGAVSMFGQSVRQAMREKNVAWIPQSSALLPWLNVASNANLSQVINKAADRRDHPNRVAQDVDLVLAELGLEDFKNVRPDKLSGGMRQRVSLARGFVQGAPLMLMDEPFSALDQLTRETARIQLLNLWQHLRRTVVFVTHSAAEAVLLSDVVVVMTPRPGRVEKVIPIEFPRPRHSGLEDSNEFHEMVRTVRTALNDGWVG